MLRNMKLKFYLVSQNTIKINTILNYYDFLVTGLITFENSGFKFSFLIDIEIKHIIHF